MKINLILLAMALGLALTATSCKNVEPGRDYDNPASGSNVVGHPKPCRTDSWEANVPSAICKLETDDPRIVCFVNASDGAISCVRVD